jgi:hypothetical protein
VIAVLLVANLANAQDTWKIDLKCAETQTHWYKIEAWGKNVSGYYLEDCATKLSIKKGDAQIQPASSGWITLGDCANGGTLKYEFVVYSESGNFEYEVRFTGNKQKPKRKQP